MRLNIRHLVPIYLFITLNGLHLISASEYEGSSCDNNGKAGICTVLTACKPAKEALKVRRQHNLGRCGFKHFTEIVCCPSDLPSNSTTPRVEVWSDEPPPTTSTTPAQPQPRGPIRKSEQACDQYSNDVGLFVTFHIVEGDDASEGEFPHMAALGYNTTEGNISFNCGGSLISNRYVITAAHCVINIERNPPIVVRLGTVFITFDAKYAAQDFTIENITVHPQYKGREKFNDIALLRLSTNVSNTDSIYPACLYNKEDDPLKPLVTGWGSTSLGGERSTILQKAVLTAVPLEVCNSTYITRAKRNIIHSQLCAVDNKSDACQGDSGGPLQVYREGRKIYSVVGITSFGIGCGQKYPGIYTRIFSYLDWIENIVWP